MSRRSQIAVEALPMFWHGCNMIRIAGVLLVFLMAASAKEDAADLREHLKKVPRSVANALKQGKTKDKCVLFFVWNQDTENIRIDEYLEHATHLSRNKKLLDSQVIVTALSLKKFFKHKNFFTGKEEWSKAWLLFVDGATETVVHRQKAYGNPDVEYKYFTEGNKA